MGVSTYFLLPRPRGRQHILTLMLLCSGLFVCLLPLSCTVPIIIILCGICIGIAIIAIFAPEDTAFLVNLFLAGLGIRLFLSYFFYVVSFVFINKIYKSPGFLFVNDGFSYSQQGWQIAKFAERGIRVTAETFMVDPNMKVWGSSGNITPYDFFTGYVYSITGYSPLSMFVISSLAGSIAALFIYLLAKELFSKNIARMSSIFAFFWPSFILWSTQNLKEPVIAMLSFIILWSLFYFYKCPNPIFLCLPVLSLSLLFMVSFPFSIIVTGAIICAAIFSFINHLFKNKVITVVIMGLLALTVAVFLKNKALGLIFSGSSYDIKGYKSLFEFLNFHRNVRAYGNLQFLAEFDISNPLKMIAFAPLGFFYAILAPFPWQVGTLNQLMAVPETLLFYLLLPFSVKGIAFAYKNHFNKSLILLVIIFGTFIFLALVEGNSGTMFRHRALAFYLLFIFTAAGIFLKRYTNKRPC